MAKMVPSPMRFTPSEAERFLYDRFERELPDDVVVVHGARWVGERHGRRGADGEADFVILDPRHGILVLEAKSGAVTRDGARGTWTLRADGEDHEIRDPIGQALDSKYALQARLAAMPVVCARRLHLVHGLAFPFHTVPPDGLGPDMPRNRVLDALALHDVTGFVRGALASADERRDDLPDLGADGVARIADALFPRREVRHHLRSLATAMSERLVRLTDEQFDFLALLPSVRRASVTGGPGTGKTLLAMELARRFALQGLDVLLLCFNGPLAGQLEAFAAGVPGVTATTFHELCRRRGRAAGLEAEVEAAASAPRGYADVLPEILLAAAERTDARHDVVIVDEAQDFESHWWVALEAWLRAGKEGRLYVFGDDRQNLYGREGSLPAADLGLAGPMHLSRNCRNTDEIGAVLAALAPEEARLRQSGVASDRRPRLTWVRTLEDVPRATARVLDDLLARQLSPDDIVVLSPRSQGKSVLGALDRLGRTSISWRERASPKHVLVDTIHRFKGLEAKAVVLTELAPEDLHHFDRLVWIGCSRAQTILEVIATPSARAVLEPALAAFDDGPAAPVA